MHAANKSPKHSSCAACIAAAQRGRIQIVKALVSASADVNQANRHGKKPIDVAKNEEIKEVLAKAQGEGEDTA